MSAQTARVVSSSSVPVNGLSGVARAVATVCVAFGALAAASAPAAAQWKVGPFIGGEHESSWDEFLVIGADARGTVGKHTFELNPRFSYFIRESTTRFQLEFNVLRPLVLANSSKIAPYIGTGVALESVSYDNSELKGESNVGFNYIMGAAVNTKSRVAPYAQFTYTVLNDSPNNALLAFGVNIKLGQSK